MVETWAVVALGERSWTGRLVPAESLVAPRLRFEAEQAPSRLPLGTTLQLGVALPGMVRARRIPARLTGVQLQRQSVEITVEPLDREPLEGLPIGDARGERRYWARVAPRGGSTVPIPVRLDEGPPSARSLAASLVDVSGVGVGLRFPLAAEPRLCVQKRVFCTLSLFPSEPPHERAGEIRMRMLEPEAVRYGLEWHTETYDGTPPPQFEPVWTCAGCGEDLLLAHTHAFCPRCGAPAAGIPTRLPAWEDLVHASSHRFAGVDRTCAFCGTSQAAVAAFCGHCGTRLPKG